MRDGVGTVVPRFPDIWISKQGKWYFTYQMFWYPDCFEIRAIFSPDFEAYDFDFQTLGIRTASISGLFLVRILRDRDMF